MRTHRLALLFASATLFVAVNTIRADEACKHEAKQAYHECKQLCHDDFVAAKLICRNVDPECGSACVGARHTCAQDVEDILATGQLPDGMLANCPGGTNACDAALLQARQACWAQYCASGQTCTSCKDTTDAPSCYECIDPAQLTAFSCRDTCRDSFRQDATVQAMKGLCKSTFKTCIGLCPPAIPPAP